MDRSTVVRRDGFALTAALVSIAVIGAALTGGFYAGSRSSLERQATAAAGILAQETLRSFAQDADPAELQAIGVGSDSLLTRVRIITDQSVTGAFTVLVDRVAPATYEIKATARVETPDRPVICSVQVRWRPTGADDRLEISPAIQPVCNGSPTRSMILVRSHELGS
jgi:hypothetical protein